MLQDMGWGKDFLCVCVNSKGTEKNKAKVKNMCTSQ